MVGGPCLLECSGGVPGGGVKLLAHPLLCCLVELEPEEEKQGELGGGRPSSLPAGGVPGLELARSLNGAIWSPGACGGPGSLITHGTSGHDKVDSLATLMFRDAPRP